MIEEAMSTTPIVFLLIILLFGFDSTGQVTGNTITAREKLERGDSCRRSEIFRNIGPRKIEDEIAN